MFGKETTQKRPDFQVARQEQKSTLQEDGRRPLSVSLSLWPRAALSFIGLSRQSIQQPCMEDEGTRQAVNDEQPKIKVLTPLQL